MIVTPGELDQHMRLLAGRWTTDFLAGLNFELAFCSSAGVTLDAGLTTSRRALADVINVASANAARTIGLIDSNKFGRASLLTIARAEELDAIVTDDGLDERDGAGIPGGRRAARDRQDLGGGKGWHDPSRCSPANGPT